MLKEILEKTPQIKNSFMDFMKNAGFNKEAISGILKNDFLHHKPIGVSMDKHAPIFARVE